MGDLEKKTIEELFKLLESNNNSQVTLEIHRLVHQNITETKDAWLVNGLYEYYAATKSLSGLQLLLNIKEPHDKMLCDKLWEGLKSSGPNRATALNMLGYIIRKQPTWLYRIAQHAIFKELLKVLKTETDVVLLMTGLLALLSLLPAIPAKISPFLADLFDVFGRLSSFKHTTILPELHSVHLHVGLYAFFHRLYGMFPCNFLSWMRQQYPETCRDNLGVFGSIIAPLLATVRMHPLLVTQSREHEKTVNRWKGLGEIHDVVAECSRYSLDLQESASREDPGLPGLWGQEQTLGTPGQSLRTPLDPVWTPGRLYEVSSPPLTRPPAEKPRVSSSRLIMDSPPEAAVEATPENTPFATPVKDEPSRMSRPVPSPHVIRNLRMRSPGPPSPTKHPTSPLKHPISPNKYSKEASPFRFPDPMERRDSLFTEVSIPQQVLAKRDSIFCQDLPVFTKRDSIFSESTPDSVKRDLTGFGRESAMTTKIKGIATERNDGNVNSVKDEFGSSKTTCSETSKTSSTEKTLDSSSGSNLSSVSTTSSALLAQSTGTERLICDLRPSPVKFTNAVPQVSPIKPCAERIGSRYNMPKDKLLSVHNLQDSVDYSKEDNDAEVSSITDGAGDCGNASLDTRHITPHIFHPDSGLDTPITPTTPASRALSRVSTGSAPHTPPPPPSTGFNTNPRSTVTPVPGISSLNTSSTSTQNSCQSINTSHSSQLEGAEKTPCSNASLGTGTNSQSATHSVDEFVRRVRKRVKQISVCGPVPDLDNIVAGVQSGGRGAKKLVIKRSLSCPILAEGVEADPEDNLKAEEEVLDPDHEPVQGEKNGGKLRFSSGTQTDDELVILPYEHLFPSALPLPAVPPPEINIPDPYATLDDYIRAATNSVDDGLEDGKTMKNEISLLHSQLLYERQRREILGARNRRLLGKTKTMRELEEQNLALRDQLSMVQAEIESLHDQLALVRNQKHQTDTERAVAAKQQEQQILQLQNEVKEMKIIRHELEKQVEEQTEISTNTKDECAEARAKLFQANAQLDKLKQKESLWKTKEEEICKLRKQILLLGEMNNRYRERFEELPVAGSKEEKRIILEMAKAEVAAAKAEFVAKSSELAAACGKLADLETKVAQYEVSLEKQKEYLEQVHDEHQEALKAAEGRHAAIRASNMHLETAVLELQEKLERFTQINKRNRKGKSPSTDSLDVAGPSLVQPSTNSSIAGSLGSDAGEALRRALDSPPVHLERELARVGSINGGPSEIGSAHSALNRDYMAENKVGSMNGKGS